jgi:hypothetical protein
MSTPTTPEFEAAFAALGMVPASTWRVRVYMTRASVETPWVIRAMATHVEGGTEVDLPLPPLSTQGVDALFLYCGLNLSGYFTSMHDLLALSAGMSFLRPIETEPLASDTMG